MPGDARGRLRGADGTPQPQDYRFWKGQRMSEFTAPSQLTFVQRATEALAKYSQLRSEGMTHGEALITSGFYDVIVKPDQARLERDIRALQANDRSDD